MLPVILLGVNIGKDAGVIHRQLQSVIKIAPDDGSGSLGKVLLQEFWEHVSAEEDRVSPPTFESGDHQGRPTFDEPSYQTLNGGGRKKRVINRGEQNCRSMVRKGPETGL